MEAPCAIRDLILQAPSGEPLPARLAEHASGCPACAEALWLQTLAAEARHHDVPPPGLLYWRAELWLRNERLEQAMRPARAMQTALPLVLAVLGAATAYYAEPVVWIAAILFALLSIASLWITRSA